ncbi:MAG: TolC family protein [Rhodothermales bacterium]
MAGFLVVSVLLVVPVKAQEEARLVTLEEALALFTQHSLALRVAQAEAAAQAGLARQAAAYPNPAATFTHEPLFDDGTTYSESYFTLSQRIEWPGVRRARIEAAERLTAAARARTEADSLRLAFEVIRTYIEVASEDERRVVLREVADVIRRAEASWTSRHTEGEVSGYSLRRIRVERARYENALALAELRRRAVQRRLAMLVFPEGDATALAPADRLAGTPAALALDDLLSRAPANRPEVAAVLAEVQASQASLMRARRERRPEPNLTAGFKRQSDGFQGAFVGATLALPFFDRNTGQIAAETALLHAAETRHILAVKQVENEVRQTYAVYASLRERVALIQEGLLAETGDLLQIALTSYGEGEMTLIELLDAAAAYRDARLTGIDLHAAAWTSYYDVLRAAGSPFPASF